MCKWHQECGSKNGQLVLQNCSKTSLKVLLPTFKPFLQQISLLQVAWRLTSDWMKLLGSHAIHGSYVTCCETSLSWTGKTRNMYRFFCKKKKLLSTFCNNLFVAREVDSWVAKHARSLFNSFCSNVANWVERFTVHLQWVRRAGNMQIALLSGGGAYDRMYFLFKGKFVYNGGPMAGGELISGGLPRYRNVFLFCFSFTVSRSPKTGRGACARQIGC